MIVQLASAVPARVGEAGRWLQAGVTRGLGVQTQDQQLGPILGATACVAELKDGTSVRAAEVTAAVQAALTARPESHDELEKLLLTRMLKSQAMAPIRAAVRTDLSAQEVIEDRDSRRLMLSAYIQLLQHGKSSGGHDIDASVAATEALPGEIGRWERTMATFLQLSEVQQAKTTGTDAPRAAEEATLEKRFYARLAEVESGQLVQQFGGGIKTHSIELAARHIVARGLMTREAGLSLLSGPQQRIATKLERTLASDPAYIRDALAHLEARRAEEGEAALYPLVKYTEALTPEALEENMFLARVVTSEAVRALPSLAAHLGRPATLDEQAEWLKKAVAAGQGSINACAAHLISETPFSAQKVDFLAGRFFASSLKKPDFDARFVLHPERKSALHRALAARLAKSFAARVEHGALVETGLEEADNAVDQPIIDDILAQIVHSDPRQPFQRQPDEQKFLYGEHDAYPWWYTGVLVYIIPNSMKEIDFWDITLQEEEIAAKIEAEQKAWEHHLEGESIYDPSILTHDPESGRKGHIGEVVGFAMRRERTESNLSAGTPGPEVISSSSPGLVDTYTSLGSHDARIRQGVQRIFLNTEAAQHIRIQSAAHPLLTRRDGINLTPHVMRNLGRMDALLETNRKVTNALQRRFRVAEFHSVMKDNHDLVSTMSYQAPDPLPVERSAQLEVVRRSRAAQKAKRHFLADIAENNNLIKKLEAKRDLAIDPNGRALQQNKIDHLKNKYKTWYDLTIRMPFELPDPAALQGDHLEAAICDRRRQRAARIKDAFDTHSHQAVAVGIFRKNRKTYVTIGNNVRAADPRSGRLPAGGPSEFRWDDFGLQASDAREIGDTVKKNIKGVRGVSFVKMKLSRLDTLTHQAMARRFWLDSAKKWKEICGDQPDKKSAKRIARGQGPSPLRTALDPAMMQRLEARRTEFSAWQKSWLGPGHRDKYEAKYLCEAQKDAWHKPHAEMQILAALKTKGVKLRNTIMSVNMISCKLCLPVLRRHRIGAVSAQVRSYAAVRNWTHVAPEGHYVSVTHAATKPNFFVRKSIKNAISGKKRDLLHKVRAARANLRAHRYNWSLRMSSFKGD